MTNKKIEPVFNQIWHRLAEQGWVDEIGSEHYRDLFEQWRESGVTTVEQIEVLILKDLHFVTNALEKSGAISKEAAAEARRQLESPYE